MLPHLGVHGRADDDRRGGGQQDVDEQVVGDAGGVGAEEAGGGRGHQHHVGRPGQGDVGHRLPSPESSDHSEVRTRSDASADRVTAPTKRSASAVITGTTWAPASTRRRQTSTAL